MVLSTIELKIILKHHSSAEPTHTSQSFLPEYFKIIPVRNEPIFKLNSFTFLTEQEC